MAVTVRRFCGPELEDRKAKADAARASNRSSAPAPPAPPQSTTLLPKLPLEPTAQDTQFQEPNTFDVASGVIDRDLLLPQRSRWTRAAFAVTAIGVAAGLVKLYGVGAVGSGVPDSPDSPDAANDVPAGNRVALSASAPVAASQATATAASAAPLLLTVPSASESGTASAFKQAMPRPQRTGRPKLVEDDPYRKKP